MGKRILNSIISDGIVALMFSYFFASAIVYAVASLFLANPIIPEVVLISQILLSGALTSFLARNLDSYMSIKIFPRLGDTPLITLAYLVNLFLSEKIFEFIFNISILKFFPLMTLSVLFTIITTLIRYMLGHIYMSFGFTKVIYTVLAKEETAELQEALDIAEVSHYVTLTKNSTIEPDLVIISRKAAKDMKKNVQALMFTYGGIPVADHRLFMMHLTGKVSLSHTNMWSFLTNISQSPLTTRVYTDIKTIVEPIIALTVLTLISPLMLFLSVAVYLYDRGPILYSQTRTGLNGKTFKLHKFRTMIIDSEVAGPQWSTGDRDPRITPLGSFLRKTHLDELPQLWNVVAGELGFVGPRPERPEFYDKLNKVIPEFSMRTHIRPGITGWAQIHSGYAASVEESKKKLEHDLYYMQNISFARDFIIAFRTGLKMFGLGKMNALVIEKQNVLEK